MDLILKVFFLACYSQAFGDRMRCFTLELLAPKMKKIYSLDHVNGTEAPARQMKRKRAQTENARAKTLLRKIKWYKNLDENRDSSPHPKVFLELLK